MTSRSLVLQLADGRFPAGGHAHSSGTEAACGIGDVTDVQTLRRYVHGRLRTTGRVDAAFAAAANLAAVADRPMPEVWARFDEELAARTLSPAQRRAGRTMGRQMLRAGTRIWPSVHAAGLRAAHADGPFQPVALGVVARAAGLDPGEAAACALHHLLTGITSAAVRLLGLDPFDVAGVNASFAEVLDALADEAAAGADAGAADPSTLPADVGLLLDVLAEHHAVWDVRLFSS